MEYSSGLIPSSITYVLIPKFAYTIESLQRLYSKQEQTVSHNEPPN